MDHQGQCITIVSGKGGTGKTSFVAGVGAALALSGSRVLCLDCDVGLRNLDLALGLSDRTLMDFSDVAQGRCRLEMAAHSAARSASGDPAGASSSGLIRGSCSGRPVSAEGGRPPASARWPRSGPCRPRPDTP